MDRTEVDMKLGDLLVEAKLTETGFQAARMEKLERYRDFEDVFHVSELARSGDSIANYQLIRCVLAAYSTGGSFCVLCDARRPDMIEKWLSVMRAVKSYVLRSRLHVLTWQELAGVLPRAMRRFLGVKYGIVG
jgi:pimeloyl-ACP methyl ester carboxylesterase